MEGVDAYVVCADCLSDYENGFRTGTVSFRLPDELAHAPLTSEDAARLRKLLDW
jgi:hypothetical protein